MAEIRTTTRVSLADTLLSFKVGDSLNLTYADFGIANKQSLQSLICTNKRLGRIPQEWKFQIASFDNPMRLFVVRIK